MKFRQQKILLALVILNIIIFSSLFARADKRAVVAFIDVGQGDAIFIRTPSGHQVLIDGGRSGLPVLRALGELMPFYDRSIDLVIATHPDEDHIGGLNDVFERYDVELFLRPAATSSTRAFSSLLGLVSAHQIPEKIVTENGLVDFGDRAKLYILYPDSPVVHEDTNTYSIITKFSYASSSVLLMGDAPIEIEDYLVKKYGNFLDGDILKAGHHGSKYSSSENFVRLVSPEYSIISAGAKNSYGHPSPSVMKILQEYGGEILETAKNGTLKFQSTASGLELFDDSSFLQSGIGAVLLNSL
jgi:competence protein ComEC